MNEQWARRVLALYRVAGAAMYPLVGTYVAWRMTRGKEDPRRRRERYGWAGRPRPEGPMIWVHAASVGETIAVASLVDYILDAGVNVVLTTGTTTSAQVAEDRFGSRIIHQYVPLDLRPAVCRFLGYWQPDLAIMAESEIWPTMILELGARRVPQVLVNGRLSDRSFRSWEKRPNLAEALFENLAHVVAQSELDGERFRALGARPVTVSGNLKVDTNPPPVDERVLNALRRQIGTRPVWAAISTHEGEERMAADIHRTLRMRHPGLLTIVVPRHPERAAGLAAEFMALRLKVVRRSTGGRVRADTDIFLGDTIGEMGLYLRLAEIAFVGRSLSASGGQNPLEPAMLETAVLAGNNVQNFRDAYERLVQCGAARLVRNREELAAAVSRLLVGHDERRSMIAAGTAAVGEMGGALAKTLRALDPYVQPLVVKSRLGNAGRR